MATATTQGQNAQQQQTTQQQGATQQQQTQTQNMGAYINQAFGLAGDNSRAGTFVAAIKAQFERSGNTGYMVGTVSSIQSQYASFAYIAFNYADVTAYALAVFETQPSSIIRWKDNANNKARYTSVAGLIDAEPGTITKAMQQIKSDHNLSNDPIFVTLNAIPSTTVLDAAVCNTIASQLVTGVESRGDRLGTLQLVNANKYLYNYSNFAEGSVVDNNGVVVRADWTISCQSVSTDNSYNNMPTLEGANSANAPQPTIAVGYVNLRYTGPDKPASAFVGNETAFDPRQLAPELVIEQIDSISSSNQMTIERDILAVCGIAQVARKGGWMDTLVSSLRRDNGRGKLSGLANHLMLGGLDLDVANWDANPQLALDLICRPNAAIVVKGRKGDGIAGLPTILSEIAYQNQGSLSVLLKKLDNMFYNPKDTRLGTIVGADQVTRPKLFSELLADRYQLTAVKDLVCEHVVRTAIPKPSGSYDGNGGKRSIDDIDLIEVANKAGDLTEVFKDYVTLMSYDNRTVDHEASIIAQMDYINQYRGGNTPCFTGDALEMVLHPVFVNLLVTMHEHSVQAEIHGIVEHSVHKDQLFVGGVSFGIDAIGQPTTQTTWGTFGATSALNF